MSNPFSLDSAFSLASENSARARYTRGRGPLKLLKAWPAVDRSAALKAEHAFKQLPRPAKDPKLQSRARQDPISRLLRGESVKNRSGAT
mgnify:CR=1 FL=1